MSYWNHKFTALAVILGLITEKKLRISTDIEHFDWQQEKVYLSIHHNNHNNKEVLIQFIHQFMFKSMAVITDIFWPQPVVVGNIMFNDAAKLLFDNAGIKNMPKNVRFWYLVTLLDTFNSVSVFVCREGQQYVGDTLYNFREGLFAASMYTQKSIINYALVGSTASDDYNDLHISLFKPPVPKKHFICTNPEDYELWRRLNDEQIQIYTRESERKHKLIIKKLEEPKLSCHVEDSQAVCPKKLNRDTAMNANKRYFENLQKNVCLV